MPPRTPRSISSLLALCALSALTGCQSAKDRDLLDATYHPGNSAAIRRLLADGASVSTEERLSGRQPIHHAAACGDIEAAKVLLAAGAKVDAGKDGYVITGNTLTTNGKSFHPTSFDQPIHVAAQKGQAEMVKFLLSSGADVNAPGGEFYPIRDKTVQNPGTRPLQYAIRSGNAGVVRLLIASGAKVAEAETYVAASSQSTEVMQLLLDAGGKIGDAEICLAAGGKTTAMVKLLLSVGANVNASSRPRTPLACAAESGDAEMVKCLLGDGANPKGKGISGETALHFRMGVNSPEVARILIAAGADVNARDSYQATPLHGIACCDDNDDNLAIARLLIKNGADLNARSNHGVTPLHEAVRRGKHKTARLLLESGANTQLRPAGTLGRNGVQSRPSPTALELAEDFGEKEIAALIREHDAKRAAAKK